MISARIKSMSIVLLSVLALGEQPQQKISFINDDSFEVLNGNVKSIAEAPVDDENSTNPGQDYSNVYLNEKGEITKSVNGFHGSIFQTYYVTRYRANGKKLETLGFIKLSDGTGGSIDMLLKTKQTDTTKKLLLIYRYNDNNQIVNYVVGPGKPHVDSSSYKYDDKGNLIEQDYYANPKLLMDVTKYKYDGKNNLIEADKFHWNGLMVKASFEYTLFDSNDNWIEMTAHSELFLGVNQIDIHKIHRKISYY